MPNVQRPGGQRAGAAGETEAWSTKSTGPPLIPDYNPLALALQRDPHGRDLTELFLLRFDREYTRRAYRAALEDFFAGPVTLTRAADVSFVDVNRWLLGLEARGLQPTTRQARVAVLRSFYAWLVALGVLGHNPAARELVRRIPVDDCRTRTVKALSQEEAVTLLDATRDGRYWIRDYALILTMIKGCLRRSEACGLDFEHVQQVGEYWTLQFPISKGGANQYVKATEDVVAAIAALAEVYGEDTGPVFRVLNRGPHYGQRLSGRGVADIIGRAAQRASLGHVHPHALRHTGCMLALEGGASLMQIQSHARHKRIETTLVYLHQRDKLAESAADYIQIGLHPDGPPNA